MALTSQSKLLLDSGRQSVSMKRIVSKSLDPKFRINLKEFLDVCTKILPWYPAASTVEHQEKAACNTSGWVGFPAYHL